MDRKPVRGTNEEGGRSQLREDERTRPDEEPRLDMQDERDRARAVKQAAEQQDSPLEGETSGRPRAPNVSTEEPASRGGGRYQGQPFVQVPPSMDEQDAALDASIRLKFSQGLPLDEEERAFLARMPGEKDVKPDEMR